MTFETFGQLVSLLVTMILTYYLYKTMNQVRGGSYKSMFYQKFDIYAFVTTTLFAISSIFGFYTELSGVLFLLFLHLYTMIKAAKIDAYISKGGKLKFNRLVYISISAFIILFSLLSVKYWTPDNLLLRAIIDIIAVGAIIYYRFYVLDKKYKTHNEFKVHLS